MIIKTAEYVGSFVDLAALPQGNLPEIALVGRSNVGKSSLINKVVNRKGLAKSSSTPGKTRTINYFIVNDSWHLVDLPGYGYAKVSQQERNRWQKMIEKYLQKREQLKGVIMLLDIRHEPNENDQLMKNWLLESGLPLLLIATKADKISRGNRAKHLAVIRRALNLEIADTPIVFSAQTGDGVEDIKDSILGLLSE
ncbi:MAG: ribosome biogenesis GTP-binding protein YihA/YsxC [Syntrophomonadaceae bacterium]